MRRAILAATLGCVLVTAGCSSDPEPTAAAPTVPTTGPAVPPSTVPTTAPPDYSANTRLVCGKLQKTFDSGPRRFGTEVGKMIAYKEAKVPAEAKKAQRAAAGQLRTMAAEIRKETSVAEDPALKTAGAASATKVSRTAADNAFFDRIRSTKDLDRIIKGQLADWLTPVAGYCP